MGTFSTHDESQVEDHFVQLHDATWSDYQRFQELRGDGSVPRLTYLEGMLELMKPSREHEVLKSTIARLVETWCLECDVTFRAFGSWTIESQTLKCGAEPDACYVFSDTRKPERPDLNIEVIWTPGRINKLKIYRALGVREVWIWRRSQPAVHALRGDRYEEIPHSQVLSGIDLVKLASFLDRPFTSQAIKEYRAALQTRK